MTVTFNRAPGPNTVTAGLTAGFLTAAAQPPSSQRLISARMASRNPGA
jgi:hypothetical protein